MARSVPKRRVAPKGYGKRGDLACMEGRKKCPSYAKAAYARAAARTMATLTSRPRTRITGMLKDKATRIRARKAASKRLSGVIESLSGRRRNAQLRGLAERLGAEAAIRPGPGPMGQMVDAQNDLVESNKLAQARASALIDNLQTFTNAVTTAVKEITRDNSGAPGMPTTAPTSSDRAVMQESTEEGELPSVSELVSMPSAVERDRQLARQIVMETVRTNTIPELFTVLERYYALVPGYERFVDDMTQLDGEQEDALLNATLQDSLQVSNALTRQQPITPAEVEARIRMVTKLARYLDASTYQWAGEHPYMVYATLVAIDHSRVLQARGLQDASTPEQQTGFTGITTPGGPRKQLISVDPSTTVGSPDAIDAIRRQLSFDARLQDTNEPEVKTEDLGNTLRRYNWRVARELSVPFTIKDPAFRGQRFIVVEKPQIVDDVATKIYRTARKTQNGWELTEENTTGFTPRAPDAGSPGESAVTPIPQPQFGNGFGGGTSLTTPSAVPNVGFGPGYRGSDPSTSAQVASAMLAKQAPAALKLMEVRTHKQQLDYAEAVDRTHAAMDLLDHTTRGEQNDYYATNKVAGLTAPSFPAYIPNAIVESTQIQSMQMRPDDVDIDALANRAYPYADPVAVKRAMNRNVAFQSGLDAQSIVSFIQLVQNDQTTQPEEKAHIIAVLKRDGIVGARARATSDEVLQRFFQNIYGRGESSYQTTFLGGAFNTTHYDAARDGIVDRNERLKALYYGDNPTLFAAPFATRIKQAAAIQAATAPSAGEHEAAQVAARAAEARLQVQLNDRFLTNDVVAAVGLANLTGIAQATTLHEEIAPGVPGGRTSAQQTLQQQAAGIERGTQYSRSALQEVPGYVAEYVALANARRCAMLNNIGAR